MAENSRRSREDIINKIQEIQKKEDELKKRKLILQRQKPWYTQASNIIGLITIIITITIAAFSFIANEETILIDCEYSEAEPFTNISPSISNNVTVLFNNSKTENIGKIKFRLTNNGTKSIKKDNFVDGPIEFNLYSKTTNKLNDSIVDVPLLLDVVKVRNANQRNDLIKIITINEGAKFTYLPSLINPGESVELEALLSNISEIKIKVNGNIADGTFKVIKQSEAVKKTKFEMLGQNIVDILGAKWIALIILIIFFLLSLLKTIVTFEGFETNLVDITFALIFFSIDLTFLALIIAVIMS
jgi:hypothetical protein